MQAFNMLIARGVAKLMLHDKIAAQSVTTQFQAFWISGPAHQTRNSYH